MPKDRKTALVLTGTTTGGCEATVASLVNVDQKGAMIWEVTSYCLNAKEVAVVFTADNPLSGKLTSTATGGKHWPPIVGHVTGNAGQYPYEIKVDGRTAGDPVLEVDP